MNTKKKILFLVTQSEFGGAQRFIYTLVNSLNRYEIVVGAGPEGDDENGLLFKLEKNRINTRHLKYLRRGINPFFDFCLGLIEIYRLIKQEKPEILFLCSSKVGAMGSLVGRLLKVSKIIYRIGGWTFNDPWPKWKKNLYIWVEKTSAKWKDYIINNAESDKQQAIKLGIKSRKEILVIHNGININELKFFNREEARKKLNLKDTDFVVGTIANNYPAKGLKYLSKAKERLQNVKFAILSKVPDASKYLKAFDIFVLPSVKEGFPWVILEAMAAEVPVIATKVSAVPEIINPSTGSEQVGILIEPKNPQQIADAITKLLNNKNLRKNLAERGKKTVIEKFNSDKMIKAYENLFLIN